MTVRNLVKAAILLVCLLAYGKTIVAQANRPQYANVEAGWQWQASSNGITYIPVCWENPQSYVTERQWVKSRIENTWESVANIKFFGWAQCSIGSRGIRIFITDTRSNSRIGRALDGLEKGMELNFTFRNFMSSCQAANKRKFCIESIAVHEFGHALGFAHEQDRDDSTCNDEKGTQGGWKVTDYDANSVMNYCNPRWNNNGELSPKDIKGVRTLYGAKAINSQGHISISDELGQGQVWENVTMDFGNTRQFFHINNLSKKQNRAWNFSSTGKYCYKVWTHTSFSDGVGRSGFGEGCIDLERGKTYSYHLAMSDWNSGGFYNLTLEPTSKVVTPPPSEVKTPGGKIQKIWVDYDVYNNQKRGMRIHFTFTARNLKDRQCEANAYFYLASGKPLKDFNGQYKSTDGYVAVHSKFTPTYADSIYKDYQLFIPYDELHMGVGKSELKFVIKLYRAGFGFFAESTGQTFSYSHPQ